MAEQDSEAVSVAQDGLHDDFIHKLRGFTLAYPVEMFGPVTDAERKEHSGLVSRASGAMGRHLAKFFAQAADVIEQQQATIADHARIVAELQAKHDRDCERMAEVTNRMAAEREATEASLAACRALLLRCVENREGLAYETELLADIHAALKEPGNG